jgi:hypothetical protein
MDQTQDINGKEFYKIQKLYGKPSFLKTANSYDILGDPDRLPMSVYADPLHKYFPCHTPAATWTSYAFYLEKKGEFNHKDQKSIENRFDYFITYHNIRQEIAKLKDLYKKANEIPGEEQLKDADFGLVLYVNGEKQRRYPLRNSNEVKAAIEFLDKNKASIPFIYRQKLAAKILDRINKFKVELDEDKIDSLEKTAGLGVCSANDCLRLIHNRLRAVAGFDEKFESMDQQVLLKFAEYLQKRPELARNEQFLIKLASYIDLFDREHKLHRNYSNVIPVPENVLFKITTRNLQKAASARVVTTTGKVYFVDDFENIKLQEIRDALGDQIADAMTDDGLTINKEKVAEVVPTLPRPDAALLDSILEQYGVHCLNKKASVQRVFLSQRNREILSALNKNIK